MFLTATISKIIFSNLTGQDFPRIFPRNKMRFSRNNGLRASNPSMETPALCQNFRKMAFILQQNFDGDADNDGHSNGSFSLRSKSASETEWARKAAITARRPNHQFIFSERHECWEPLNVIACVRKEKKKKKVSCAA